MKGACQNTTLGLLCSCLEQWGAPQARNIVVHNQNTKSTCERDQHRPLDAH